MEKNGICGLAEGLVGGTGVAAGRKLTRILERIPEAGLGEIDELIRSVGPLLKEKVHVIQRCLPAAQCALQAAARSDIRSGKIGRRGAQKTTYAISANLIQMWLTQYDRGELDTDEAQAALIPEYEAKIAALERKVGQLTMELDLAKKTPRLRLVSDSENLSIVSGPKVAPSDGGAK